MAATDIAYETATDLSYEDAVQKCREALTAEGFGVLTEIDIKATLKKKLDVDVEPHVILGACHPPSAHRALKRGGVARIRNPDKPRSWRGTWILSSRPRQGLWLLLRALVGGQLADGVDDLRPVG